MISTFLVEHASLVPVAGVLVALVCVGGGRLLAGRPEVLWTLTALSLGCVAVLTLVPTPRTVASVCSVQVSLPTLGSVEALANIALLFPAVFLAALATRRPLLMVAVGALASAGIETVQALLPALGRSCDTNDWAMNTLGAALAALLATITLALAPRRPASRATPGAARSFSAP